MKTCPKCQSEVEDHLIECPDCGIVFAKYKSAVKARMHGDNATLRTCPSCMKMISKKALACPFCGDPLGNIHEITQETHKNPEKKIGKFRQAVGSTIFACFVCLAFWAFFIADKKETPNSKPLQVKHLTTVEIKQHEEEKRQKEEECKRTLNCWADRHDLHAITKAERLIERSAKYSFEWTDGFLEPKLSNYKWKDKNNLIITYIGDKIKFQNGFGAWQNMIYFIDYDTLNDVVVDLKIEPGRL